MGKLFLSSAFLRPFAYLDGYRYAHESDDPLCLDCIRLRGFDPLDCLRWQEGYGDGRKAQGWSESIDWRGSECRCGK